MQQQMGVSLISILVGLLISSIILVGMLMIFQGTIRGVVSSTQYAHDTSDRMSGLLVAQQLLHDAGFGIDDPDPDSGADLLQLNGGALSLPGGSEVSIHSGLVWRAVVNGHSRCEGIAAVSNSEGHGLLRLSHEDASCNSAATGWSSLTWQSMPLAWHRYLDIEGVASQDQRIAMVVKDNEDCWPFGLRPDASSLSGAVLSGSVAVTLTYPLFDVGGVQQQSLDSTACLTNFH